jgi:conjugative relaxase-like TrwC/TraI family protein
MKYTITPLGGAGRPVTKIVGDVVGYLLPGRSQHSRHDDAALPDGEAGTARPALYYADSGEGGRWSGRGAAVLGLHGDVHAGDFAKVLAGRAPATGERLISAQGSAGRRPKLGVGTETRHGSDGGAIYDACDASAVLGLAESQVDRMIEVGTMLAIARLFGLPVREQPAGSYLVPVIGPDGSHWVTDTELSRCEDALSIGTTADDVAATGPPDELLGLDEAARIAGVTVRYLRRLAKRYETDRVTIDAAVSDGRPVRRAYLAATRVTRGRWVVTRGELGSFLERRRPPAVRVGYDLTLTTEKSLGVLALLAGGHTRDGVLDAIGSGNDWAMAWLERHAAATRAHGEIVPVNGWTVASFLHHTSRALDPFPHVHNVVANTVEDAHGERRALDARGLYRHARAASALATAEMRHELTRRLGVRWRRAGHGGWEIAGIPDDVLREFSRRGNEIDDALRELEEAIGRGARPDEIDHVKTTTRPNKTHVPLENLLADWWRRAEAHGFDAARLASCVAGPTEPLEIDVDALYAALAAPDGICANLSVFDRDDVLVQLVHLPVPQPDGTEPQPLVVDAARLEEIADGFLRSSHVTLLAPEGDSAASRYSTREMLAVQGRIVARYRQGRDQRASVVPPAMLSEALARHPGLTDEQQALVRSFCTSGHRTQLAIGRPGAGKTTAMAAARDAWNTAGQRVMGAAVKGEAARTLGATARIPTETLAWYLAHNDPLQSPLDARTVLIVDEASTISDRDLDRLGWLAGQTGATLRLIGDPAQHGAVEAGGMFRVLCERHESDVPQLTRTHRLLDPHDRAAADHLRHGDIAAALDELDTAGHLHIVDDDLDAYTHLLTRWWDAHRAGQTHPIVSRRNDVRCALNRLAHQLRRAAGEIGTDEIHATDDRRYSTGDRVIARIPNRHLHPPGRPTAYVRNGATGTIAAARRGVSADGDTLTVDFDDLGTVTVPRSYFDEHDVDRHGRRAVGIDHAYAVTSYAVTGATHAVSTSRIDETSTRAETYVDITRGQEANHLYLTRPRDDLDGEHLPRTPPDPVEDTITRRLTASEGERTAWEIREDMRDRVAERQGIAIGL